MKRAAIFDFDGVIINSTDVQRQAFFESYRLVVGNGSPSFEEFLSHSGDSIHNIFSKMNLPLEMVEPYRRICRGKIDCIKIYAGVEDLLIELRGRDILCGLCTGKDRLRTVEILRKIGFYHYFDVIVCSDDVKEPKPHPESLIFALNKLGVSTNNAVMIGDARNDIICARKAGVSSIAVTWGDISREALENESPDYISEDIGDLAACMYRALLLEEKLFTVAGENER